VGGAALDVFPAEPFTEHPIFAREDVVVTPHLGASTAEAQDRAGIVTAEQVTAALTGGVVTNAVNIAAVRPEEMEALAPFVPLCEKLGRLAEGSATGSVDRVTVEFRGASPARHAPARDRGPRRHPLRPHRGAGQPGQRAADGRGARHRAGRDQGRGSRGLHRAGHGAARLGEDEVEVAGTGVGPRNEPYLVSVWGESFYLPFAEHIAVFRYADRPGMIGRVGTMFGEEGVNIVSAAVGAEEDGERRVMALTTDAPVRAETIEKILQLDGFSVGRSVDL
jgi:D-3-phosphoglycerate dehydrogenase